MLHTSSDIETSNCFETMWRKLWDKYIDKISLLYLNPNDSINDTINDNGGGKPVTNKRSPRMLNIAILS